MPRREITSFSNPTIKALRSLREKKHRQRERRFLAEGLRLLTDARESGRVPEVLVMAQRRDPHPYAPFLPDGWRPSSPTRSAPLHRSTIVRATR